VAREKKSKRKKATWQQFVGILFMITIGAACGAVSVSYLERQATDTPFLSFIGLFLGLYFSLYFHMAVHEAGHLVFGLMSGYKFSSYRVGSFMLVKERGRLRLRRLKLAGTGGQCLMTPPDLKDGKIPVALYNLGGVIMNVAVGLLGLFLYFLLPDIPLLSPVLLMLMIVGFMTAMLNGIPMRMGTIDNDGYNAFALSKNKEAIEAFWVQLKLVEQNSKGVRLKDMPAEWFTVPTDEAMKNSMVAARGVFACNRLMDEERFEDADRLMAHLLEIESGIVGLHRSLLVCDRAYVELIGENRAEVIDGMMTKEQARFMKAMKRFPTVLRTQYALALLQKNDTAAADAVKKDFDKAAKSYPYPHEIDSERELMRIAEEKAVALKQQNGD